MTAMKKLILSALLTLSPAALAGGYAPAMPTAKPMSMSVVSAPATAAPMTIVIPARPLNTASNATRNATSSAATIAAPAANVTTPAQARAFLLTAPSGTKVTLKQKVSMQIELEDVQTAGSAAEEMSAEDIQDMKDMFAEMSNMEMPGGETVMSVGQVFASGARELVTTTVTEMPAETGEKDITISVIQTVEPDGKVSAVRVQSDNADMQQMFDSMSDEMKKSLSADNATSDVYGFPLVVGHTMTSTDTVDMQALMGGMMAGMLQAGLAESQDSAAEIQEVLSSMEAQPLTATTTTTYKGLNAQGEHVFGTVGTAQPWSVKLNSDLPENGGNMALNMTLSNMNVVGDSAYRADGLPSSLNMNQDMRMKMDMTTTGEKAGSLSMTMRIKMNVSMAAQ